jgi:hypothetical protein
MYTRVNSADLGRLDVSPSCFPVGSRQIFALTYTAGARGVGAGGQVRLLVPRLFSVPNTLAVGNWAEAPGYTRVDAQPEGVELALSVEPPALLIDNWRSVDIVLTVVTGELAEGEQVRVQYGGWMSKVVAPRIAGPVFAFDALVDPDGAREGPHAGYTFIAEEAPVETLPGEACRLEVFAPSVVGVVSELSVLAVTKDRYHNPIKAERLPSSACRMFEAEGGRVLRVEVRDDDAGLIGRSNPVLAAESNPAPAGGESRLYWGDLHAHTSVSISSVGALNPDGALGFARDIMGLDFVAITDAAGETSVEEWENLRELSRQYSQPGCFAAFPSFEFYSAEAAGRRWRRLDRNVVFRDPETAKLPRGMGSDDFEPRDSAALLRFIDPKDVLIIPHQHPGGDWEDPNRAKMRLVEIYSHWGAYEHAGVARPFCMGGYQRGSLISEALAAGMRLGFVAGSDDHTGHPGNDFYNWFGDYPGGLTAVWADALTPEAIWQALYQRRCYATTRARIYLAFSLNDAGMGAELRLPCGASRRLAAEVHGTAPFDEVTVVRNGEALASERPGSPDYYLALTDADPLPDPANTWYYLRVIQRDGEMAWSSPIWVSEGERMEE